MNIPSPAQSIDHPDYNLSLQEAIDLPLLELIDQIGAAGWDKREAFKAIAEVVRNQALAYEDDPDPEDHRSATDESAPGFGSFPVD